MIGICGTRSLHPRERNFGLQSSPCLETSGSSDNGGNKVQIAGENANADLRVLAEAAHDMRTPLTVIGLSAHLLQDDSALDEDEKEQLLVQIAESAREMEAIISGLLAAARDQHFRAEPECIDLKALTNTVVADYSILFPHRSILISTRGECRIRANESGVKRVITNLLSNAIKFSTAASTIRVEVSGQGDDVRLCVQDEGVGMDADELEQLFHPFTRLRRTRDATQGQGLGLSSVKTLLASQNGRISVYSTVERGTLVEVMWPRLSSN